MCYRNHAIKSFCKHVSDICLAFLVFRDLTVSLPCNSKRNLYTYFINDVGFSPVGGLYFTEGNSCCRVLESLLQTFILCFLRVLDMGSVISLLYCNMAYSTQDSEGSLRPKNVLTNSSGLGEA